jgi:phage gpG-like protein
VSEAFTSYIVDNDKSFRNAIKRVGDATQDLRIPFGQILRDFYKSEQAIFKLKSPGKYPDYVDGDKSKYAARKQIKRGFRYPLLVDSGRLAASMLGPNNPGSISKITKLSLTFGTSVSYGIYHQSDKARKTRLPQRKFLFIGPEAPRFASSDQVGRLQRWLGYLNDHMANAAIREGIASRLKPGGSA